MKLESKAKLSCVALALLISAGAAQASDATKALDREKWHPWIELGGYGSSEESRGETVLFAPFWQSSTALLFTDIRGKVFDGGEFEGNVALGLRAMQPSGWNLGAWVGWDIRHTEFDNTFNQVAFGFEAIRPDFDVRVNGYVPTDDSEFATRTDTFAALLAGNAIFVQQTSDIVHEYALYGVDAEVGFRVPPKFLDTDAASGPSGGVPRHELRLYGGGFWFDQDDFKGEVAGPRARLEWRINDVIQPILGSRLTIEAEYQHDEIRDHQFEVGARFRIPFGGGGRDARNATLARLTGQERRMMDGLERDVDIIVERQTETTEALEAAIDNETDVRFDRVAYVEVDGDLQTTLEDTDENSLIILLGGTLAGGDDVKTGSYQTLQGGASTIFIRGAQSGAVVPFTAPGTKPTVQAGGGQDVLIIDGDNVHIAGLGIDGLNGTAEDGIDGDNGLTNIVLQQNMITDTGKNGIDFDFGNSNIRIFNNMITDPRDDGIDFEGFNWDITITGNAIDIADGGVETDGVDIAYGNTDIRIIGNIIDVGDGNDGGDGIEITGGTIFVPGVGDVPVGNIGIYIANNTITLGDDGEDSDGIFFGAFNEDIIIVNNEITIGGGHDNTDGIFFGDDNRNINIFENIIRFEGGLDDNVGIFFGDRNENIDIFDNKITVFASNLPIFALGSNGIYFNEQNKFIDIFDNTITVVSVGTDNYISDGIFFGGANEDINIVNNVITVGSDISDGDGIFFGAFNGDIDIANNVIRTGDNEEDADGIELVFRNTGIRITGNTITPGNDGNGITIGDAILGFPANNNVIINDNLFNGPGFVAVFNFVSPDNFANGGGNSVAPGITPTLCAAGGPNAFFGRLEVDGEEFINGVGCN